MREKKWTPGPWRIGAIESGRLAVDGRNGEQVTGFVEGYDAYLIKAAPVLVEALEEAREWIDGYILRVVDEALAEAYGETR